MSLAECVTFVVLLFAVTQGSVIRREPGVDAAQQKWGYVTVRSKAHMFWWLYYTTASQGFQNKPLVMWLQGGPGGSSTGFGNFEELGPLNVQQQPRNTTWLTEASLLFVDNPVGAGFSYVDDPAAFTTTTTQIALDLVVLMQNFMDQVPDFETRPFYIFTESYGGKMTASFSQALLQAIKDGSIKCDFRGIALGDSWISPIDSVLTWGPFLHATSLVDKSGLEAVNKSAYATKRLVDEGRWAESTNQWGETENIVESVSNGVNFYNILKWSGAVALKKLQMAKSITEQMFQRHVGVMQNDDLSELMNGPIRKYLKIIPNNVTWGGQSGDVFQKQQVAFMKPVVGIVDDLIENSSLSIVVYSGQLDLIVDTEGTELWVDTLKIAPEFRKANRKPLYDPFTKFTTAFVKKAKNFSFYWILDAGHMVPADNGNAALEMLRMVTNP